MTNNITSYRYQFVHESDADFIAYQGNSGDDVWQTISLWMIPTRI